MTRHPKSTLDTIETVMLDMDGTVLDLAFDNFMWLKHVPDRYAAENGLAPDEARDRLYARYRAMHGRLEWYCLDHWSDKLGLDIAALHREQNHRIGYLPGAEDFLAAMRERDVRLLLVTNSHLETLKIKDEVTGIGAHFDAIYSSHEFGAPKERRAFWDSLEDSEDFDPATTLFVDDTVRVLDGARDFGLRNLVEITHPDTSRPKRKQPSYRGVAGLSELL